MLGASFLDSALTALGDGRFLYSDDERLRNFAAHEYRVRGVCTQQLLRTCADVGAITEDAYRSAVVQLMTMHYRHTWFDADILLDAARKSGWRLQPPFSQVIAEAGDERITLPPLAVVVARFIFGLEGEDVLGVTKAALVNDLLSAVVSHRPAQEFAQALKQCLRVGLGRAHRVWVSTTEATIDAWLRTHPQLRRR
jgi:hypothetical protein